MWFQIIKTLKSNSPVLTSNIPNSEKIHAFNFDQLTYF
jgi:hypothetical protein